jgi:peptidoglycan hydrolase-like protein with peptidoglycan-binding domain
MEMMEKTEEKRVRKGNEEIRQVQEALKAKGEDPDAIDGIMGKKTAAALEKLGVQMGKVSASKEKKQKEK